MSVRRLLIGLGIALVAVATHVAAFVAGSYYTFRQVAVADSAHGRFVGTPKTEWIEGRDMRLTEDFVYIDPMERAWLAPQGSVINGASIPRALWTIVGGPFEGKYRNASIVHDVACEKMDQPYHAVHRMFYDACLAGGVEENEAGRLYYAVAMFGPRWVFETMTVFEANSSGEETPPEPKVIQVAKELVVNPPTPGELEKMEALFRSDPPTPEEIERLAKANAESP